MTATREERASGSPARYLWAMLLARLFESLPLTCPSCGADIRIVAFITEAAPVERILTHIGEPAEPPLIAPARGPPAWDDGLADAVPDCDTLAQPEPEYLFDQQVRWKPPAAALQAGSAGGAQGPARPLLSTPASRSTPAQSIVGTRDFSLPNYLALAHTPLLACSRTGSVSLHPSVVRLDFLSALS